MLQFVATVHVLGASVADRARTKLTSEPERGSTMVERVLLTAALIALVGMVVAVIRNPPHTFHLK